MGLVTLSALVVCGLYLWRFSDDRGLVPFLLGCALLVVGVLHAVAWRESRSPLLIADMTGLRVRLGGRWAGVPWAEVETIEVAERGRWGDGRVVVRPRDEVRALADAGPRARLAVVLNRWLYDAPLVVPYGLTTTLSHPDVLGALTRLADGRVPVVAVEGPAAEPEPTVEVAQAGTLHRDEPPPTNPPEPAPRRLAGVVSALRSQASRLGEATVPIGREPTRRDPVTIGALALSGSPDEETEPLPELSELRRRAPEDEGPATPAAEAERSPRTANVELIIDATTDLSAQAMRKVRLRPGVVADAPGEVSLETDRPATTLTTPTFDTPPNEVIGSEVHRAREWLGMTVDDLAERTRIRPYVIESIEVGDFSPCGGDFYARGHLRMLSAVLGVDPTPLVATYDAHLASAPVSPRAVFDAELTTGVLRPTGRGGSRWGALIAAVLVLLLVWGLARYFLTDTTPTSGSLRSPSHNAAGLGSPGRGDTLLLRPPVPPTTVTLTTTESASRVVVWDKAQHIVFQGMLPAGTVRRVSGPGPLRVMAVNGGAVSLATAGHPKAPLGQPGHQAVLRVG